MRRDRALDDGCARLDDFLHRTAEQLDVALERQKSPSIRDLPFSQLAPLQTRGSRSFLEFGPFAAPPLQQLGELQREFAQPRFGRR
ncbi:MAG TPA: hypothetical protein VK864_06875, partial [Longimicrobiales bacterium]|nr:hypothetical protein [Longimicrobiales bacterium]